jgi:hypothetical protein
VGPEPERLEMTKLSYTLHRVLAGTLFLGLLFALANYYLNLGFFGEHAKGVVLIGVGLVLTYVSFFAPTRDDRREHSDTRNITKKN